MIYLQYDIHFRIHNHECLSRRIPANFQLLQIYMEEVLPMVEKLKEIFPMIRERKELLCEIRKKKMLSELFEQLSPQFQEEFLNFCTGMSGAKILRDSFFKEVMNPEYDSKRLESLLSVLLGRKVMIVNILPNDATRIADEMTLLITDILVELEDGSLANVEIQKIGYAFPGARGACYSADMLLRQYRRVRARKGEKFAYNQIKNVFLIVIFEDSPKEFKKFPDIFYHHAKQIFDTGLEIDMLQEYIMIPLDIYRKGMDNKSIETPLEAWLTFLSDDRPERIIELITKYPEFKPMYETLYQMCMNIERVMNMFFSEELRIMDRNTVQYMIDEQQKEIEEQKEEISAQKEENSVLREEINTLRKEIIRLKEELEALKQK